MEDSQYWKNRPKDDSRKDWRYGDAGSWIEEYFESRHHPHRKLIMKALESLYPFDSLIEFGCNAGPNLGLIEDRWPEVELTGVDINPHVIEEARGHLLPSANLIVSDLKDEPTIESFDVLLCDACLMYVSGKEIIKVRDYFNRIADNIIIVDWDSDSKLGKVIDHHWARDYRGLLEDCGFDVEKTKITNEDWPSPIWQKNGYIYVARR